MEETVTISQGRYEELLDTETRVNVAVERIGHDQLISMEDVLYILGTKEAVEIAEKMREEAKRRHEEYERKKREEGKNENNNQANHS